MYTAVLIRRHINRLQDDKPFSIRDFLNYGFRNSIDQVFYRLVKSGFLKRVARGLYVRGYSSMPSVLEVALAKAKAFGKTLVTHGSQAPCNLHLDREIDFLDSEPLLLVMVLLANFVLVMFGSVLVVISQRKISLGEELVELTVKALWYLGKANCSAQLVNKAVLLFNRQDRQSLREKLKIMPAWLANYFS